MKPITINNWRCYVTPYTKLRIAESLSTKQEVQYNPQRKEFNFTFLEVESKIPEAIFLWLLNNKLADAWDVGAEAALHLGTDDIFDRNPYKE